MFPGHPALALGFSRPFGGAFPRPSAGGTVSTDAVARLRASVTRRLVDGYAGALCRVRRSSDSTEADIGQTVGEELDTAALLLHTKTTHITTAGALHVPGTASVSQGASVPDEAALRITDDMELMALIDPATWAGNSGTAAQVELGRWDTAANQRSYYLGLEWDGSAVYSLSFRTTTAGTAGSAWTVYGTASIAGFTGRKWVRVSRRKSDGRIQFFTADPGVDQALPGAWTQLGSNRTGSTAAIHVGTAPVRVGAQGTNSTLNAAGKVERVVIMNGLLGVGSTVLDIDFVADADRTNLADTFTCDTGQVVTLTRSGDSAYIRKVYDQSGNSADLGNSTAAEQPRIVNAGALEVDHAGIPTARFRPGGSETHRLDASITVAGQVSVSTVFSLGSTDVAGCRVLSLGDSTDDDTGGLAITKGVSNGGASWFVESGPVEAPEVVAPIGDIQIVTAVLNETVLSVWADGTAITPAPAETNGVDVTAVRVGDALQGSKQFGGTWSELSVWEGVLT